MSRLGKKPLAITPKAEVSVNGGVLTVKGPKGTLSRPFSPADVAIAVSGDEITLTPSPASELAKALWGTYAAHLKNMMTGVTDGYTKKLLIEGVGYRAEVKGNKLVLMLGFSHPVEFSIPEGVTVTSEKGALTISGIDKDQIGQFSASVRAMKKPEPYKGKGIRYEGEYVMRKQGKRAV